MSYESWKQGRDDALKGKPPGGQRPGESDANYGSRLAGAKDTQKNK